jgi:hypothetical protein
MDRLHALEERDCTAVRAVPVVTGTALIFGSLAFSTVDRIHLTGKCSIGLPLLPGNAHVTEAKEA